MIIIDLKMLIVKLQSVTKKNGFKNLLQTNFLILSSSLSKRKSFTQIFSIFHRDLFIENVDVTQIATECHIDLNWLETARSSNLDSSEMSLYIRDIATQTQINTTWYPHNPTIAILRNVKLWQRRKTTATCYEYKKKNI